MHKIRVSFKNGKVKKFTAQSQSSVRDMGDYAEIWIDGIFKEKYPWKKLISIGG